MKSNTTRWCWLTTETPTADGMFEESGVLEWGLDGKLSLVWVEIGKAKEAVPT